MGLDSLRENDAQHSPQGNAKWVKLGCAMLTTLLASPEGVRLLSTEDEFLQQIRTSFAQLDPVLAKPRFVLGAGLTRYLFPVQRGPTF